MRLTNKPDIRFGSSDEADEVTGLSARTVPVSKITGSGVAAGEDSVAVEEPLEIKLAWPDSTADGGEAFQNIAVTMRTPSDDEALAVGFLFTEGILRSATEVVRVTAGIDDPNSVTVFLVQQPALEQTQLERNFYMTSSCGVCGKASVAAIRTNAQFPAGGDDLRISGETLLALPEQLERQQRVFRGTGSIHAAARFGVDGIQHQAYEDVGRHNAVDKLVGSALLADQLPMSDSGILVSGRASFELVQKARMAGCAMLAAVGAPSSLAIDLAWDSDMTLIGFLRDGRFNVYTGPARVI